MLNFNQFTIWQYTENNRVLNFEGKKVKLYHDGKWMLKQYEEGKKVYMMNDLYTNDNIFDFCYWLNSKELTT